MQNCEYCGQPIADGEICQCRMDDVAKRQMEMRQEAEDQREREEGERRKTSRRRNQKLDELEEQKEKALFKIQAVFARTIKLYFGGMTTDEYMDTLSSGETAALSIANILVGIIVLWAYGREFIHSFMLLSPFGSGKGFFLLLTGCIIICFMVVAALMSVLLHISFGQIMKRTALSATAMVPMGLIGLMLLMMPFVQVAGLAVIYLYLMLAVYCMIETVKESRGSFLSMAVLAAVISGMAAAIRMFLFA